MAVGVLGSAGMVDGSSMDCCDEGTMDSSGGEVVEGALEIFAPFSVKVAGSSCGDEGVTR